MLVAVLTLALLARSDTRREVRLEPGARSVESLGEHAAGATYRVQVALEGRVTPADRLRISWREPSGDRPIKSLHAGDPDLYLSRRAASSGPASIAVENLSGRPVSARISTGEQAIVEGDRPAFEAEPNDSWRAANPMILGRAVYGSADDVDYLENSDEGRSGLDWFRFEVAGPSPVLAYFHLELLDRDVSANLRVYRLDPRTGEVRRFEAGKDPMEVVHDRERERYSTHLSRTLARGTYFLEVNANHPDYILRTRTYPVPPMADPSEAVEAGLEYLLQVGDAWFAQVPREGNIFQRSSNLHDTATRCTACHASSFPTEASLVAHRAGYPIRAKSSMLYLMDRIGNSPTPLYGGDGLYWQRFIAIPLQAQGKQGGILLDYERQVLGRETPEFERFGPFLKAAWLGRRSMPADEVNGVVPLDSKFGLAWRDWRVLTEMTRRTGQVRFAQAADAIADLLGDPANDRSVETLQDRIHRLHAWGLIDPDQFAGRIRAEAESLLALQNPDGGWHELDRKPGPSADYTTGQLTWTLLRLGYPRDDPRIARALAYLLARQQPFGGWFQATTHENFRTPMRETRYAIEALAEAFPRPGAPLRSWGNRSGQPARAPGLRSSPGAIPESSVVRRPPLPNPLPQGERGPESLPLASRERGPDSLPLASRERGPDSLPLASRERGPDSLPLASRERDGEGGQELLPLPSRERAGERGRVASNGPENRGSILETLDDLEDLWDVPEAVRPEIVRAVLARLGDAEPMVRARASACLGRIGDPSAVEGLIGRLNDPSKLVWRSAAWALRRLGNRGIGVDAIARALDSPDPATRRGASRIFAYQFSGMDTRVNLADRLIRLTGDPDLWTRLQALRSLRQWFYRTGDDSLRRRIVDAYLARMADPDEPVIRKALSEGMYILLDENLGGGVSLQKNLAALPEKYRRAALQAREAVERDLLLGPILRALGSGNALQREALVGSFDGSFFRGRTFARRPSGMLDVGNDREFGFLYEPPEALLDRTFAALLNAEASPEVRRGSIRLASFFLVPGRTEDPAIQSALLRGMLDPDPVVSEAARDAVATGLTLRGAEDDPSRVATVRSLLDGPAPDRRAIARALARNPALLARPPIRESLRERLAAGDVLGLLPVLGHPSFADLDVLAAIRRAWPDAVEPADRLAILETLLARPALVDAEAPPVAAVELLRLAMTDPSTPVRERTLGAIGGLAGFRSGKAANHLILSALADDAPGIRRQALTMATPRGEFWARPDARERLLALLVDPDARARELALSVVDRHRLAEGSPGIARRVKSAAQDPSMKVRAESILSRQGLDPSAIRPDLPPRRPRLLSLSRFRSEVEPLFYRAGTDGYSCASCHANHNVLRVGEGDPSGDRLMINYASALKVINLGDPESSLLLRKPRSPQGQGGPDPSSPTGLTHVGGPRWEDVGHPSYRAILGWVREASAEASSSLAGDLPATADGHAPGFEPAMATDGDPATSWQTESVGANPGYPHELVLDLGSPRVVEGLLYVPRQDSSRGRVKEYEVSISVDGRSWSDPVARGTWPDDPAYRLVALPGRPTGRYVRLRGLSSVDGQPGMSVAELAVDASPFEVLRSVPLPPGEGGRRPGEGPTRSP